MFVPKLVGIHHKWQHVCNALQRSTSPMSWSKGVLMIKPCPKSTPSRDAISSNLVVNCTEAKLLPTQRSYHINDTLPTQR